MSLPEYTFRNVMIPDADQAEKTIWSRDSSTKSGDIEVIFRDHADRLSREIIAAQAVFGCCAWLTNRQILIALASKAAACIIVQKEDFLRPDSGGGWSASDLRALYDRIPGFRRYNVENCLYSCASDPTTPGVMCAGFHNHDRRPAMPRMHHKFMVFCKLKECENINEWIPYAVWTGSFNPTFNGDHSLENAVLIRNHHIASAYLSEFSHVLGIAERLNWHTSWVQPTYRIGT